jgi:hypothetical protein
MTEKGISNRLYPLILIVEANNGNRLLTFGELRCLTGFLQTVLLPLLATGIPGQIPLHLQRLTVIRIELTQGPGNAHPDGIGVTG